MLTLQPSCHPPPVAQPNFHGCWLHSHWVGHFLGRGGPAAVDDSTVDGCRCTAQQLWHLRFTARWLSGEYTISDKTTMCLQIFWCKYTDILAPSPRCHESGNYLSVSAWDYHDDDYDDDDDADDDTSLQALQTTAHHSLMRNCSTNCFTVAFPT